MLQSGIMRHRIKILEDQGETVNDFNESIPNWKPLATRWGSVEPLSGRELWQAKQVQADVTHRVRLRYFDGLKTEHQLEHGGKTFHIFSVRNPDALKIEHECICREVV